LPRCCEEGPRQHCVRAGAGPTAIGWEVPLGTEQASLGVPTMWAGQPIRVEVTFEPKGANAVIQEVANRKVYQVAIIP
jgi:hypothetical protein